MPTNHSTAERETVAPHTPGPYRIWTRAADGSLNLVNHAGEYVCLVGREQPKASETERVRANAAFLLRAVNSHEVLLAAAQFARSVIDRNGVFETSERMAIEKLDAAIAKAEVSS